MYSADKWVHTKPGTSTGLWNTENRLVVTVGKREEGRGKIRGGD